MSNRVLVEIVFGRDWLDQLVAYIRGMDIRIAIFAWAFTGVVWGVRKGLQGLFRVINFANSALSRQMEFNADLVAVSVTGSDALINGLARLDFANDALGQAWSDLTAAADHQLYSRDLFYHQTRAAEYLRAQCKDPHLGEPPALPEDPHQVVQVFQPEDTSVPKMWATHPSNYDREVNAKRQYIRNPVDNRSAWILFQNAAAVREQITRRVYQLNGHPEGLTLEAPEVVQAFIDEEHAETTYHPRYHGLYDHRYLTPGDLDELIQGPTAEFAGADRLAEAHALLYGDELKARMEGHRIRQEEYGRLAPLARGAVELTGKDFQFRGVRYRAAEAGRLLDKVRQELDQDYEWMAGMDHQAFLVHYEMARQVGDEARREIEDRYRFHLALQRLHGQLSAEQEQVQTILRQLAGKSELAQEEFRLVIQVLGQARDALSQALKEAANLRLPSLKNVTPGEPLGSFLLKHPLKMMVFQCDNSLDGKSIGQLLEQLGEVLDKAQRIHFKSLGGILALQERLSEQWLGTRHCPAQASAVEASGR
jgi:hypothetical protein